MQKPPSTCHTWIVSTGRQILVWRFVRMSPVTATTLTAVPAPRIAELITPLDADFPNPTLLGLRRASRRLRRTITLLTTSTVSFFSICLSSFLRSVSTLRVRVPRWRFPLRRVCLSCSSPLFRCNLGDYSSPWCVVPASVVNYYVLVDVLLYAFKQHRRWSAVGIQFHKAHNNPSQLVLVWHGSPVDWVQSWFAIFEWFFFSSGSLGFFSTWNES